MMNITNKSLIKDLTKIIKARNKQAVNLPSLYEFKGYDEKYITKQQYQELIALDRFIKDNPFIETERIKSVLKQEFKKFKYLQFCNISIEEFVATLKNYGVDFIANEMVRQQKEREEHLEKERKYLEKNKIQ